MLHAPPISLSLTWSPWQYVVRITDCAASHCAVFFTPLLPCNVVPVNPKYLPCQNHSCDAQYAFNHLSPTLYNLTNCQRP
jgi:hypothetical protein